MAKREPLGVWLHGVRVAELHGSRPGEVRCRYTAEALDAWPSNIPLLSCSLPLTRRPQNAKVFFSGLLPEGRHRQAMAAEARVPSHDTFGMLARFGKDVAGACVIAHEDPGERPGDVVPYDLPNLEADISALPEHPLGIHDDSELSLAGIQDKLLLVDMGDGRWGRPIHGRPSTHILKVEDRRYAGMADMEATCLQLARALELTTIDATVETIAAVRCLIVSRFDRVLHADGVVTRVHQEDACQALNRDPEAHRGLGKYERAGGPTLREVATLLDRFADDPVAELQRLVRVSTFTTLIGNADAHGKNIAFLHLPPDKITLAPLYDTVPTVMWPNLRNTGAMTVNQRQRLADITLGDVTDEAKQWPLDPSVAGAAAIATAEALLASLEETAVPDDLRATIGHRTTAFLRS